MYYNVSDLVKGKIGSNREWSIEPVNLNYADLGLVKIKSGNFNLIKIDKGIWVEGLLEIVVNMNCIRCLNTLDICMDINIDEEYIYDYFMDKQFDDNFTIDDSNHLSLRECLREYVFVTSPRKPVCKKICKL
ncbi:MAG: hypothetical protein QF864_14720 [SAR202 cluster bacterium]|jgi:uncharacterized metal-binding protein YceD (DUF177 family)|nr:hypothetical protein [SAR202 cluster bacterium]|tara:strand:- start:11555 stop:11950 length:396 start_codon:yes stop_codon:yes gene_type:complete